MRSSAVNPGALFSSKELLSRIWMTLLLLMVYRVGTFITLPGVNPEKVAEIFGSNASSGLVGMLNMFSGGALGRMSIFALNIMPYIVSSIVIQVLFSILKSEGKVSSDSMNESRTSFYSKICALVLSFIQGYVVVSGLEKSGAFVGGVEEFHQIVKWISVLSLFMGTFCLIWIGDQISSRGVGNGISMIIFTGIIAEFPSAFSNLFSGTGSYGSGFISTFISLALFVFLTLLIIFFERSYRNVKVVSPRRRNWSGPYNESASEMPIKLNVSGVIPPIFANAIILLPLTLASFGDNSALGGFVIRYLSVGQPCYFLLYTVMIVFFCFFYSDFVFNTKEIAESLQKSESIIAGKRPGVSTKKYLDYLLVRVTTLGSVYLAFICVVPELLRSVFSLQGVIGGTSLLIVVNVVTDLLSQIQVYLFSSEYSSFLKKGNLALKKR